MARPTDRGQHRALHGLTRSLIANMVEGVTDGFEKRLEIQGVGYRAKLQGKALELSVGYSHPVSIQAPDGIEFEVPQPTEVIVRGIDKQLVGETAARIRRTRPPEPYKGKGIRYAGEHVRRKVGQAGMSVATKPQQRLRRRRRVRAKVRGTAERPRLSVFRSNRGDLRPADRRRRAADARRRQLDRARAAQALGHRAGHAGRRAARRAGQGGGDRDAASSTVAGTATTAASARWPRAPARAASSSDDGEPVL